MGKAVGVLKNRIFTRLWLHGLLRAAVPAALVLGSLALALRFLETWPPIVYGLAPVALLLAIAVSFFRARSATPSDETLLAWLDKNTGSGGLLMATEERDAGSWDRTVLDPVQPHIRLQLGGPLSQTLLALGFALVCYLIPNRWVTPPVPENIPNIHAQTQGLEEKIEVMEDLEALAKAEADLHRETLEAIEATAGGEDPAQTWEALDHLEQRLEEKAFESAEATAGELEEVQAVREMAQMLDQNASALDPNTLEAAMSELQDLMERLARENEALAEMMENLGESAQAMSMSQLAEALGMTEEELRKKMQDMQNAQLVSKERLEQLSREAGEGGVSELLAFLDEEGESGEGGQCKSLMAVAGGEAGISRGPGHMEMTWTDGTDENAVTFKPELLPPGAVSSADSARLGMSAAAPEVTHNSSTHSGLTGAAQGAAGANTHQLLPKHRSAVSRYFKSKKD